jgi:hypothetical protein
MEMVDTDKDVGNGKAPFGSKGEGEVRKEVQEEVQGEEVVGKGQGGMVEMVTYNSLTVDPILGKLFGSSFSWFSFWLDLDIVPASSEADPERVLRYSIVVSVTLIGFPSDELEVIAWHDDKRKLEDGTVVPVKTIQGLAHRRKPQYGVQFHPEVSLDPLFLVRVLAMSVPVLNDGPFFFSLSAWIS